MAQFKEVRMNNFTNIIRQALDEDKAYNDVTTLADIFANKKIKAELIAKQAGVICGLYVFAKTFQELDKKARVLSKVKDGAKVRKGQVVAVVAGHARAIITAERTALNFIQYMSGIATLTHEYVLKVKGTKAKILDTRKTAPGLRALAKYAVRCGGGYNHRMDLAEMALIKDNHLGIVVDLEDAVRHIKRMKRGIKVEVECENLEQIQNALWARADIIMLDNMNVDKIKKSLKLIKGFKGSGKYRPETEVSGGVTLSTVRKFAQTGVDRISVGALTHSAPALDLSLEIV